MNTPFRGIQRTTVSLRSVGVWAACCCLACTLVLAGCAPRNYPEFANVTHKPDYFPLPVVLIPGIKGSVLEKGQDNEDKKVVWGLSGDVVAFSNYDDLLLDYPTVLKEGTKDFADDL